MNYKVKMKDYNNVPSKFIADEIMGNLEYIIDRIQYPEHLEESERNQLEALATELEIVIRIVNLIVYGIDEED